MRSANFFVFVSDVYKENKFTIKLDEAPKKPIYLYMYASTWWLYVCLCLLYLLPAGELGVTPGSPNLLPLTSFTRLPALGLKIMISQCPVLPMDFNFLKLMLPPGYLKLVYPFGQL